MASSGENEPFRIRSASRPDSARRRHRSSHPDTACRFEPRRPFSRAVIVARDGEHRLVVPGDLQRHLVQAAPVASLANAVPNTRYFSPTRPRQSRSRVFLHLLNRDAQRVAGGSICARAGVDARKTRKKSPFAVAAWVGSGVGCGVSSSAEEAARSPRRTAPARRGRLLHLLKDRDVRRLNGRSAAALALAARAAQAQAHRREHTCGKDNNIPRNDKSGGRFSRFVSGCARSIAGPHLSPHATRRG